MLEMAPAFAERVRGATREARFAGTAVPNYLPARRPRAPPPDLRQLLAAARAATGRRWTASPRVIDGVTSPADHFSEENAGRILAQAAYASGRGG